MKTTRRQELRTNDLSQQIEHVRDYVKKNQTLLTVVILGVAVALFGGLWFYNQRVSQLNEGWEKIGPSGPDDDVAILLDRYRSVALQQTDATLTTSAWLRLGNLALGQLGLQKSSSDQSGDGDEANLPTVEELTKTVEEAFSKVLSSAPQDLTACGEAMIAMGIVQENQQQFDAARDWYEKIIEDPRFKQTPFIEAAKYRLAGLGIWSEPIEFPPAPAIQLITPEDPIAGENSGLDIKSIGLLPEIQSGTGAANETSSQSVETGTPTTQPAPAVPAATIQTNPAPTTQPAGG